MSTKVKNLIFDLKDKDKKKRQKAAGDLEKECLKLTSKDMSVLEEAISALEQATSDKDKNVKKNVESTLKKIRPHLNSLKSGTETTSWDTETSWDSDGDSKQLEITEATEVTKQSEDALLLKLEETQEGIIDIDGKPIKKKGAKKTQIDAKGLFTIQNTGEDDRIWDIDIRIKEIGLGKIEETYHINELHPQEIHEIPYEITDLAESLPLHFQESIFTMPESEEPTNILVFGQTMETTIKYNLKADKELHDIEFQKTLPGHFSDLIVASKTSGDVQIKDGELVWTIPQLNEEQETSLELTCTITVEDTSPKRTGEAKLKYLSSVEGAFSGVDVDGADGLVKNFSYVESD
ncbi:MAG: hypothetical protein ACXAC7_05755, partial [Candidatus Hodarchaeales archaeon]